MYITPIRNWGTYSNEEFINGRVFDEKKAVKDEVKKILDNPCLKEPIVRCVI